jgi:Protein of unknown function (DUF2505)
MTTNVSHRQQFPAPPERVWSMLTDTEYIETKALRSGSIEVKAEVDAGDGETKIISRRRLPAKLPSFMKKVVGDEIVINEAQLWGDASGEGARKGTFVVDFGGQPMAFKGSVSLKPNEGGTEVVTEGQLKASVRFVGSKVEAVAQEWMIKYLQKEEEVAAEWLADH